MRIFKLITLVLFLLIYQLPAYSQSRPDFRTFAYISYWGDINNIEKIDYNNYTDIIYAFAIPSLNGDGTLMPLEGRNDRVKMLKKKCVQANSRFHLGLGGWAFQGTVLDPVFTSATSTEAKTNRLVQSVMQYVDEYGFDGVDLDWEFPGAGNANQFSSLTKKLADALHARGKELLLSLRAFESPHYKDDAIAAADYSLVQTHWHSKTQSINTWNPRIPKNKRGYAIIYHGSNVGTHAWKSFSDLIKSGADPFGTQFQGTVYGGINSVKNTALPLFMDNGVALLIWELNQDYYDDPSKSLGKAVGDAIRSRFPNWRKERNTSTLPVITSYPYTKNFANNYGNWTHGRARLNADVSTLWSRSNTKGLNAASGNATGPHVGAPVYSPAFDLRNVNGATFSFDFEVLRSSNIDVFVEAKLTDRDRPDINGWTTVYSKKFNQPGGSNQTSGREIINLNSFTGTTKNLFLRISFSSYDKNLNLVSPGNEPVVGLAINNFRMDASGTRSRRATGIANDVNATETVQFFPNPVKDVLSLRFSKALQQGKIKIYNMQGTMLIEQKISKKVNVSNLHSGCYILSVEDEHQQTLFTQRFIKNK